MQEDRLINCTNVQPNGLLRCGQSRLTRPLSGSYDPKTSSAKQEGRVKQSVAKAILTDVHFWVPAGVLIFGIVLLGILR